MTLVVVVVVEQREMTMHSFLWCTLRTSYCTERGGVSLPLFAVPVAIEAVPAFSDIHCNATSFVGVIDSIVHDSVSPLLVLEELPSPLARPVPPVVDPVVAVRPAAVQVLDGVVIAVASPGLLLHSVGTLPHIAGPDNIGSIVAPEDIHTVHSRPAAVGILELPERHDMRPHGTRKKKQNVECTY